MKQTLREKIKAIIYHDVDVERVLSAVKEAIEEVENYREYTPKEDMYGVGYDQAKKDIQKLLE